ncbi:unnamed protein product [Effrenium voratum]|nr:unnamed protein product [Effrenium voratum]
MNDLPSGMDVVFSLLRRLLMRETFEEDVQVFTDMGVSGYVSRVMLSALGDLTFEGEECATEEAAQSAAVASCLDAFASVGSMAKVALGVETPHPPAEAPPPELVAARGGWWPQPEEPPTKKARTFPMPVGRLPPSRPEPKVKVKAMPKPPSGLVVAPDVGEGKAQLHSLLSRIIGRSVTKADVTYEVFPVEGGFQAILTLPTGGHNIAGHPATTKKDAEQSAAALASEWLQENVAIPGLAPGSLDASKTSRKRSHSQILGAVQAQKVGKVKEVLRTASSNSILLEEGSDFSIWRDVRLEPCTMEDVPDPASLDYYYGQICLVCQVVVSMKGWEAHATGKKHSQRLQMQPMKLRSHVERPLPTPPCDLLGPEHFRSTGAWCLKDDLGEFPAVLTLGEMDFSFSLAVANLRPPGKVMVATSYLAEHDPSEVEVHPADDGERATYCRKSLPGMAGALNKNISRLRALGAEVLHSVDATNLEGTLRTQGIEGGFHIVVFPFPRYSLSRAPNPCNSRLLRDFFTSVTSGGFLLEGGLIQLVMLSSQYEDWDVNGVASDAQLRLTSRVALPGSFYQPREMSGKAWTPAGAELLTFEAA